MNQLVLHNLAHAQKVMPKFLADVKSALEAGTKQVIESRDYDDGVSDQQRRYYHGYILEEISKQARVNGIQHAMPVWKEWFRKTYLGSKRIKTINPMTGKKSYYLQRVSSEDLGVRGYNRLINLVTDYATLELDVNFYIDFDTWIAENEVRF
jgi:hypothetical protein